MAAMRDSDGNEMREGRDGRADRGGGAPVAGGKVLGEPLLGGRALDEPPGGIEGGRFESPAGIREF
jgi:hypothetical protein